MKSLLKILYACFSISVLLGCSAKDAECDRSCAASIYLTQIEDDLLLMSSVSEEVREKIQHFVLISMARKALMISVLDPDVGNIKGNQIEALCLLVNNYSQLEDIVDHRFFSTIQEYMQRVDSEVKSRIAEAQGSLKGEGCLLSPGSKMKAARQVWM